ncbi:transmembrane protein, putative (macronuclear) [Tetrahymena thermophila SB210]|uniref:Transmembrane protein, putative n=1 Tax=Tetrahymena thermophila (strain SB210) TaxID=312017 RepID=Q23RP8_TETTS|nr:transmembrane protein, putative [Tetrahymena thermophila SB210]EAR99189.2 transmembrane protein, putative [Tetrahymena thermophila SB210]|eukprot:XP_001019434.2 transmembrane protein, putative [Tetrahymena thermophila SB210]
MLLNLLTIFGLILQRVLSEETIDAHQDINKQQTTVNFSLGSPSAPQKLIVYFGTKIYPQLGQFIIDQSYTENNEFYNNQIQNYKITFYNMKKSTTAQILETFEKEDQVYDQKIQGVFVNDMLSYNKIQSKFKFVANYLIQSKQQILLKTIKIVSYSIQQFIFLLTGYFIIEILFLTFIYLFSLIQNHPSLKINKIKNYV